MRDFASDNHSGAHPAVLEAVVAANEGHAAAYGADQWTARAEALFRDHFGDSARAFLVLNGTGANVTALRALARPFDAVICPSTAHLNVDECGAPERFGGVKLLEVDCPDGKLTPELAATRITHIGDEHVSQAQILSISQSTELGTVYTPEETRALAGFAHERGMLLHLDGARLSNAAASLGVTLRELVTDAGVDALSFGGTKNALLFGDAVVLLDPELATDFKYLRKQSLQLASKMRFLGAQFEALLSGDLWLRCASHANLMARRLGEAIESADGAELAHPVEANGVFARLPDPAVARLFELPGDPPFHVWASGEGEEGKSVIRLMCSWDTGDEDIERFSEALATATAESPG